MIAYCGIKKYDLYHNEMITIMIIKTTSKHEINIKKIMIVKNILNFAIPVVVFDVVGRNHTYCLK